MKFLKFNSIRNKLIFTIAIVAITAVLLTTSTFVILEILRFKTALNNELESTSRIIATHSAAALEFGDPAVANETLEPLAKNSRIAAAYILDINNNVFASYIRQDLENVFLRDIPSENVPLSNNYIAAKNPVMLSGNTIGYIYIVSDLKELRSRFIDNIFLFLLTFIIISILVLLSSLRIEGLISKPILNLAKVAKNISLNKDYTKRAEKNTDDEIGHLVESFNDMIGEIEIRDEELENRVKERTNELELEVAERTKAEKILKFKTEYEQIILELSNNFINLPPNQIDAGINNVLKQIVSFSKVDRCSIFQFDEYQTYLLCTHRWAESIEDSKIHDNEIITSSSLPVFFKKNLRGETVNFSSINDLPSNTDIEKAEFERWGIKCFTSVPIIYSNSVVGFVCFDSLQREINWPEFTLPLLSTSGEMLVNAIKRKKVSDELHESRMMLRTVMDNIPQAIFWKDINSVYLGCNNTFAKHAGKSDPSEIVGFTDHDLPWNKSESDSYLESERRIIATKYPEYRVIQTQHQDEEKELIIEVNRIPLFDSNEKIFGILGTYEDITERKIMEEELIKNQKLESLGVLAGGIAHDFNNLLTGILGSISLARMELESDNLSTKRLKDAEQASLRARDLTFQLLTFAKGGEPLKRVIDISNLIEETTVLSLRGSNVGYEFYLDDNLWPIKADEGQISQVINNIVINADQSMQDGGVVRVYANNISVDDLSPLPLTQGNYIKVEIRDSGIGIEKIHHSKIFDPYFTTKKSGHGLGLASAYSIINKHNGYINFDSVPNKGTSFYFYLPATLDKIDIHEMDNGKITKAEGYVLIMDDEAIIRDVAGEILESIGCDVELAENGFVAIEKYKEALENGKHFDAVILDLTVPGSLGGKETIRKLLELDPNVKAIVSTGYSNDPVMSDYKTYGFTDSVPKPYKASQLAEVLFRVLNN
ncbi:MAG: ATP-binding protein [Thermodesulfobacteriota bacterium]